MTRPYSHFGKHLVVLGALLASSVTPGRAADELNLPVMTLAQIRDSVNDGAWENARFQTEGRVCGISPDRQLLALQDESGVVLLGGAFLPPELTSGNRIAIEVKGSTLRRDRHSIQIDGGPLIQVDGHHDTITRSLPIHLEQGLQPFRLEWFNGAYLAELKLEYEGPGIDRCKVPAESFVHDAGDKGLQAGLRYQVCYKDWWVGLADFADVQPVDGGVVPDLDLGVRPRQYQVGLIFSGYMKIPASGTYTFHLGSDDGARLFIGTPCSTVSVLPGEPVVPEPSAWTAAMPPTGGQWSFAEGNVSFVDARAGALELEVSGQDGTCHVTVLDRELTDSRTLLGRHIKVRGVGRAEGLVVINRRDMDFSGDTAAASGLLTLAAQVRRLQPDEARKAYRAQIRGVVTTSTPTSLVIQDSSGGVFVRYVAQGEDMPPMPGEYWQIEGDTDPGDFSPIILAKRCQYLGSMPMPAPVRPTWEQIAGGTLDAEIVEIEGVVSSASITAMGLLTRDGQVQIFDELTTPLPTRLMSKEQVESLPGSVVRIRGVFNARWDQQGRVYAGFFQLGNASLSVDQEMPADPFAAEAMRASDLLLFTSHSGVFKRVKVTGTVLHSRPPELFLSDGARGFRILGREVPPLKPGDQVEAAGFPRLGGPSPVLMESFVRKTGDGSLPAPVSVSVEGLSNAALDSTRVTVEGNVLSDTLQQTERVIEVQAGSQRFVARLAATDAVKSIERGSLLRLTGTYASESGDRPATGSDPFELLLNRPADLQVLKRGPWWTLRHTIILTAVLSGVILLVGIWNLLLRRTVTQRSRELALEIEERQTAERHRELEQERTRVAHDLHDELGAGLTEAGILTSLVKNPAVAAEKKDGYLDQLAEVCRGLVTGLDEIVWAINPRYDSVADLAGYFSLFAQRFLGIAGIQCRLQIAESVAEHPLDSHVRHHLFLAFKEALNNIVRHSRASEVHLTIAVEDRTLGVELADNGCGFDPDVSSPGSDGLAGMMERMGQLGGTCRVSGHAGGGTEVEFRLPLERSNA